MNTLPATIAPLARRTSTAAVLGVLLAVVLTLLSPVRADAAYYAGTSGRIGTVNLHGPMIHAYDVGQRLSNGTTFYSKNWNVGSYTIARSPSSWSQRVTAVSTIQRWDGRWVDIQTRTFSGNVSGSGTLTIPAWTWSPAGVPGRASYRVNYQIAWTDSRSGQFLAYAGILPNQSSDNKCSGRNFFCVAYTDGLNF